MFCQELSAQEGNLTEKTYLDLAEKYKDSGLGYLAYLNYFNYYLVVTDTIQKQEVAKIILDICAASEKYEEAEEFLFLLSKDIGGDVQHYNFYYAYLLTLKNQFSKSELYLRMVGDSLKKTDQYNIIKAFNLMMINQIGGSKDYLLKVGSNNGEFSMQARSLTESINTKKDVRHKSLLISVPLSAVVPGSGQLYSGFKFDAAKSFITNALFGFTTYTAWHYELSMDKSERNYLLPATTSIISAIFYFANIYNTVNVTQKANLYYKNQKFKKLAEGFTLILDNSSFRAGICIDF